MIIFLSDIEDVEDVLILLLSDLKKSTRTIIRGKSKTPKTLPALIIRGKKIVQFSKKKAIRTN